MADFNDGGCGGCGGGGGGGGGGGDDDDEPSGNFYCLSTKLYPKVSGLSHNEINNNNNNNKHSLRSNTKSYGGKTH
jgi:hypothetical protein